MLAAYIAQIFKFHILAASCPSDVEPIDVGRDAAKTVQFVDLHLMIWYRGGNTRCAFPHWFNIVPYSRRLWQWPFQLKIIVSYAHIFMGT